MHRLLKGLSLVAFPIAMVLLASRAAASDLTVTPTRIVFEGRDRAAQVHLVNRGDKPAVFRIEFVQMRMDENGGMSEIESPNERELFADALVRHSPRQVQLGPGEGQNIRLLLRKPESLAPGEYRSHLLFYAIPDAAAGNDIEREAAVEKEGFSVDIRAIYRISIPVIVRHGDLPVSFSMTELSLVKSESRERAATLRLRIDRDGRRSIYGDLDVYYRPKGGGDSRLLHHMKDFVLYTSSDTRVLETELVLPAGVVLDGGEIHAVYSEKSGQGRSVLAERRIVLP